MIVCGKMHKKFLKMQLQLTTAGFSCSLIDAGFSTVVNYRWG